MHVLSEKLSSSHIIYSKEKNWELFFLYVHNFQSFKQMMDVEIFQQSNSLNNTKELMRSSTFGFTQQVVLSSLYERKFTFKFTNIL